MREFLSNDLFILCICYVIKFASCLSLAFILALSIKYQIYFPEIRSIDECLEHYRLKTQIEWTFFFLFFLRSFSMKLFLLNNTQNNYFYFFLFTMDILYKLLEVVHSPTSKKINYWKNYQIFTQCKSVIVVLKSYHIYLILNSAMKNNFYFLQRYLFSSK